MKEVIDAFLSIVKNFFGGLGELIKSVFNTAAHPIQTLVGGFVLIAIGIVLVCFLFSFLGMGRSSMKNNKAKQKVDLDFQKKRNDRQLEYEDMHNQVRLAQEMQQLQIHQAYAQQAQIKTQQMFAPPPQQQYIQNAQQQLPEQSTAIEFGNNQ